MNTSCAKGNGFMIVVGAFYTRGSSYSRTESLWAGKVDQVLDPWIKDGFSIFSNNANRRMSLSFSNSGVASIKRRPGGF